MSGGAAQARSVGERVSALCENVQRVVRGKREAVRLAVVALLARGHLLLEDVPGVGKTTLARALARSIASGFRRIQFTSDLLPSDVLGVSIFEPARREFEFHPGPLFTNVLLADELNRAMPKTQGALLEAMNEGQVSVDGRTLPLPRPFIVLATQNPVDHQGTFPLPESQLDRFMLRLPLGYPPREAERLILQSPAGSALADALEPALDAAEVLELQEAVERVRASEPVIDYVLELVAATRSDRELRLGASPRGAQTLFRAARALALVEGRDYVLPDDVKQLAVPVLAHRVLLADELVHPVGGAAAEGVIRRLLAEVPVPL